MLLSVFDRATVSMSGGVLTGAILQYNFTTQYSSMPGFTTFLGKPAIDLGYPALYPNGIVPAVVARRDGDDIGLPVSPAAVRRHALIIYNTG